MSDDIIPFGKLKGKPVFALAEDKSYAEWLLAQPWFKEKHLNIYNVVINNLKQHDDTPEHNEIQIKFLDTNYSSRLAYFLFPDLFHWNSKRINQELKSVISKSSSIDDDIKNTVANLDNSKLLNISDPSLENGYDVSFFVKYGLDFEILNETTSYYKSIKFSFHKSRVAKILVEIKPTIGEDFPSVLRQLKASMPVDNDNYAMNRNFYCLLVREYIGRSASREQFVKYFESQKYKVVFASDIESLSLPVCEEYFKLDTTMLE